MPHLPRAAAGVGCAAVLILGPGPLAAASTAPPHVAASDDGGMPGMDHGSTPGTDHGSAPVAPESTGPATHEQPGTTHDEMPGMGHSDEAVPPAQRPRSAVLGSFVGVNAAVMGAAAFLRRRGAGRRGQRTAPRSAAVT